MTSSTACYPTYTPGPEQRVSVSAPNQPSHGDLGGTRYATPRPRPLPSLLPVVGQPLTLGTYHHPPYDAAIVAISVPVARPAYGRAMTRVAPLLPRSDNNASRVSARFERDAPEAHTCRALAKADCTWACPIALPGLPPPPDSHLPARRANCPRVSAPSPHLFALFCS